MYCYHSSCSDDPSYSENERYALAAELGLEPGAGLTGEEVDSLFADLPLRGRFDTIVGRLDAFLTAGLPLGAFLH